MKKVLTKIKNMPKKIVASFAVVATALGIAGYSIVNAGVAPVHHKSVTTNNDGTYKISLDITGDADITSTTASANVLLVYDTSGSMLGHFVDNTGSYAHTGNYVNTGWRQLYKRTGSGWNVRYVAITDDEKYTGTVYYYDDYGRITEHRGTRYTSYNRASVTEKAVNTFVSGLLAKNTTEEPDNVEVALVTFSTDAEIQTFNSDTWTTSNSIATWFNTDGTSYRNNTYGGITNWEGALDKAKDALRSADKDNTYVVFITDGAPTANKNGGTGTYNVSYYKDALDEALAIQNYNTNSTNTEEGASNTELYAIYAFGTEADNLDDLVYYAHNGEERTDVSSETVETPYYYKAEDNTQLQNAIDDIFAAIIDALGITSASIKDGTTNNVKATSGDMNYNLLSIDEESYEYWMTFPITGTGDEYKITRSNLISGDTYEMTLKNPTNCNNDLCTYDVTWEDHEIPVKVTGIVDKYKGTFKYKWTESNDFYKYSAPEAELVNGTVEWDLSSVGTLLDGVTYTVTFDVWPSQYTLDLVADLKNELKNYSELDDSIKEYLKCNSGNDNKINSCTLYTNTEAEINWKDTRDENPEMTHTAYTDKLDPVATDSFKMTIKKNWDNQLPNDTHGDSEYPNGITFKVIKDNNQTTPYDTKTLTKAKSWSDEINISAGVIQIKNGKALIREVGHDYTFAENPGELKHHWDLEVETVRPMIINGELTTLVKVKENDPEIGDTNMLTSNGVTYYKLPNKKVNPEDETTYSVYYVRDKNAAIMNATNVRRSNLNITKEVTGEAPKDAEFTFKLKVKDALNGNLWFSIQDENQNTVMDNKYISVANAAVFNPEYNEDGEFVGYYEVSSNADITVTMKAGWNLRFTNLPLGSTYTFEEIDMPNGFIYDSYEGTTSTIHTDLLPVDATENEDGTYTYNGKIYTKVTDSDNNVSYTYEADVTKTSGDIADIVSGTIYTANTSYVVKYTNEYQLTNINVVKTWDDKNNQDGKRPESITVRLFKDGEELDHIELTSENALVTKDETTGKNVTDNNTWVYTFAGLQKFDNGREIVYTITEDEVDNYNVNDGEPVYDNSVAINVKATNTMKNETINVTIQANGSDTDLTATLNEDNNYRTTINDLDYLDDDGNMITYTAKINGQSNASVRVYTRDKEIDITNKYTPEIISKISGEKVWVDNGNTLVKPNDITVTLTGTITKEDGTKKTVYPAQNRTVNEASDWKYEYTNLNRYAEGIEIDYVLSELSVNGYTTEINVGELTQNNDGTYSRVDNITNTLITTELIVTKVWDDNNNQDGKRPETITVQVKNGEANVGDPITIDSTSDDVTIGKDENGNDTWTYTISGLNKYSKNGDLITYTVEEKAIALYKTPDIKAVKDNDGNITGYTITNSYETEDTTLTITKVWDDNNDQDGKRPTAGIEVTVKNGENVVVEPRIINKDTKGVTLGKDANGNDTWTYTFTGLDKYENGGSLITYTVEETAIDSYQTPDIKAVKDNDGNVTGYTITNSHEIEKTDLKITKSWVDNFDQDGIRPDEITVLVKIGNDTIKRVPINKETPGVEVTKTQTGDKWTYTITGLDKYKDGKEITYTIDEAKTAVITGTDGPGTYGFDVIGNNITNRHTPETKEIEITKVWKDNKNQDGARPATILVDVIKGEDVVKTITIDPTDTENVTVTNTDNGANWTIKVAELDKYEDGEEIFYTVSEQNPKPYNSQPSTDATNNDKLIITNTYETKTTEFEITKTWSDNNNQDGKRPTSITVNIKNGNNLVKTETFGANTPGVEVTENGNKWTFKVTGLDMYANGNVITYTIEEVKTDVITGTDGPGTYAYSVSGYNITNTHTPEKTEIPVTKNWVDAKDQDGKRPTSILVQVMNGTTPVGDPITIGTDNATVTETDNGATWTYTITGLDKYANGKKINYTIEEVKTDVITGTDGAGTYVYSVSGNTITNTHTPETTDIVGKKVWSDANNLEGYRPEKITIRLFAGTEEVDSVELTEADADKEGCWIYSFTDLPKYSEGKEISYTVSEDKVDNYETYPDKDNQYIIINEHVPSQTEVTVTKEWNTKSVDGIEDPYGHVKDINVTLEGKVGETVYYHETVILKEKLDGSETIDENGKATIDGMNVGVNWTYKFENLPEFREGTLISYTVAEDTKVTEYNTVVKSKDENHPNDIIITNTYNPGKVTITGTKVWDDASNQDGARPENITINLFADGEQYGDPITIGENIEGVTVGTDENGNVTWTYVIDNLPMKHDGKEIEYTITENEVDGYDEPIIVPVTEGEDEEKHVTGYTITNTHTPETISFMIHKIWTDNENNDGKRPETITVRLLADGVQVGEDVIINGDNGWYYEFVELPKYKNGEAIVYSIEEDEVKGYTTNLPDLTKEQDVYDITNKHEDETINIEITKTWDDYDDVSNIRPTEIEVDLLADGKVQETYIINEENGWAITIENLPKFLNGEEIVYTIYEHEIAEYETTIEGNAETGFNIINHHELGKGNGEEPEILPPQTGIEYNPISINNYIYLILIIISLLGINIQFIKNN